MTLSAAALSFMIDSRGQVSRATCPLSGAARRQTGPDTNILDADSRALAHVGAIQSGR